MPEQDIITLAAAMENAVAPLDSFSAILRNSEFHDIAQVGLALVEDSRVKLRAVAQCLEAGCGRPLTMFDFGGILAPVPCRDCPKKGNCGRTLGKDAELIAAL